MPLSSVADSGCAAVFAQGWCVRLKTPWGVDDDRSFCTAVCHPSPSHYFALLRDHTAPVCFFIRAQLLPWEILSFKSTNKVKLHVCMPSKLPKAVQRYSSPEENKSFIHFNASTCLSVDAFNQVVLEISALCRLMNMR